MKFLFIVQGEGRGHLTQAIALYQMLTQKGHEVISVLVGKSNRREIPDFFYKCIEAPVLRFESPNFLPTSKDNKTPIGKSVIYNIWKVPVFLKSSLFIRKQIKKSKPDIVINFYDLLAGITYALFAPSPRFVCIAHQYLLLHPAYEFPKENKIEIFLLKFFTRHTCIKANKLLALSFKKLPDIPEKKITVVPPLLRKEILAINPSKGDYIHGYMLNETYEEEIVRYNQTHPDVKLHFFWDKKNVEETVSHNPCLSFHKLNDKLFIEYLAGSAAYATTAGFESVCEAIYFGKPVLMIPTHIEQACNAYEAQLLGIGIIKDKFEFDKLIEFIPSYKPNEKVRNWIKNSRKHIMYELTGSLS